jgi:pimeloyl-ACP methyl ester carboxylesterase
MTDFNLPETRCASSGDFSIAFQVMGDRPIALILVPGLFSHIDFLHELPGYTAFLRRLSNFARVVTFDKRGQGLSDRIDGAPSLEERMDDLRAIMDVIGSRRAVLLGVSEGCPMSMLFAATYPERVSHLILFGGFACAAERMPEDVWQSHVEQALKSWGTGETMRNVAPSRASNPEAVTQFAKYERLSSSPGALRTALYIHRKIDVTSILPTVRVPTLVLHSRTDAQVPVALGRELAQHISGAQYIEYSVGDHYAWLGDTGALLDDIEEFVMGQRQGASTELERVLATVLFTDIVAQPGMPSKLATGAGVICWISTISLPNRSSATTAAFWSKAQATAFWRRSTVPAAPSGARSLSAPPRNTSACRSAQACTPARSKFGERISVALRCTLPREL